MKTLMDIPFNELKKEDLEFVEYCHKDGPDHWEMYFGDQTYEEVKAAVENCKTHDELFEII